METFWMIAFFVAMAYALYVNNWWYNDSLKTIAEWERFCNEQNNTWSELCRKQNKEWVEYYSNIIKEDEVKDGIQEGSQGDLSGR